MSTSSEVLEAGEDTKLKVGEEVRLVSGDDSEEAESLELKSERRYRLRCDSMWMAGYDGIEREPLGVLSL